MDTCEGYMARKASKHRLTRLGVEERRQRIATLMIHGLTPSQILLALKGEFSKLTPKTIENDVAAINKQLRKAVTNLDVEAEVGKILASYTELEREAWQSIQSADKPKERIRGIKALSEVLSSRAKLLERAGLLVSMQRVIHEHGDTWAEKVRHLRVERGLVDCGEVDSDDEVMPLNEWNASEGELSP